MILAQEYGITHKLLFGTDYPSTRSEESINGMRQVNHIIGDSSLPRVSDEVAEAILARDALSLLGIEP
jgi:predicted TIM-barrel fold metal-dependent hydrolase